MISRSFGKCHETVISLCNPKHGERKTRRTTGKQDDLLWLDKSGGCGSSSCVKRAEKKPKTRCTNFVGCWKDSCVIQVP
jgi:hypothetical protein